METIDSRKLDSRFKYEVAATPGGENLNLCFACGTCTAGCPVSAVDPEFNPRTIIRKVLLGMKEEVLSCSAIWRCVQCYSCTAKCPQNVKFREIVRALREIAVADGHADASLVEKIEELDELAAKARRDMATALADGSGSIEDARKAFACRAK